MSTSFSVFLSGLIFVFVGAAAFAEEGPHGASAASPSVRAQAAKSSLQAIGRLSELIEIFDELKRQGKPFRDAGVETTIRLLHERFRTAADANSLLPGSRMTDADQTVWFDNLGLLYEYVIEILSLEAADGPPVDLSLSKRTAAANVEKKWRILGKQRRKNWIILDAGDASLGAFGKQEALRREKLVGVGNAHAFDPFVDELTLSLQGKAGPVEPARPGAPKGSVANIVDQVKNKDQQVDKLVHDYDAARKAFQKWKDENITGKTADQITDDVHREALRRSSELRRLEDQLRATIGDLPTELKEAIDRFKRDPRKFVDTEYDTFLKNLRDRDPAKAADLERLVGDYKKRTDSYERLLAKYRGKTAQEIGQEGLDQLRKESAAVRQFEDDVKKSLDHLKREKERLEKEVKAKGEEIRKRLNGELQDFKQNDVKRIEGDLKRKIEDAKKTVDQDLKDLKRIFDK